MSYSYKCYSDTKDFMKKFVNAEEGAIIYGISKSRIIVIAREAGAVYKVGNSALINTELFEKYLERGRVRSYLSPMSDNSFSVTFSLFNAEESFFPLLRTLNIRFKFSPPSLLSRFTASSMIGVVMRTNPASLYVSAITF